MINAQHVAAIAGNHSDRIVRRAHDLDLALGDDHQHHLAVETAPLISCVALYCVGAGGSPDLEGVRVVEVLEGLRSEPVYLIDF